MATYSELAPLIDKARRTVWSSLNAFERSLIEALAAEVHAQGQANVDELTASVLARVPA